MRTKYFITPFGVSGTITPVVPNATDPSGYVSYNEGFTFDYQRDLGVDSLAKSPTYVNFNTVLNDITTSLQALQQGGVAEFITSADNDGSAFSYGLGALVLYSAAGTPPFNLYLSLVNANTALPSVTANWLDLTTFHSFPYGPLNQTNTWTATQTHTANIVLANLNVLQGKDTGGTARNMLLYGSDNLVHLVGGTSGFVVNNSAFSANNILVDDTTGNTTIRGFVKAAVGTGFSHVQVFSTAGSSSFTVPSTGIVEVEVWGGGGGSGGTLGAPSGSQAGAAGGYSRGIVSGLTPGSGVSVTVGAGGANGNQTPTNGTAGGSSSFGSHVSATGGGGGAGANGGVASGVQTPGTGTGGDINVTGGSGNTGFLISGTTVFAAQGGAAFGSPPAHAGINSVSSAGIFGVFPGGGASGSVNQENGAVGAGGLVIVRW